jgi:hypothetical protein
VPEFNDNEAIAWKIADIRVSVLRHCSLWCPHRCLIATAVIRDIRDADIHL